MKIKTKRCICGWVSILAFAAMFGVGGGVEQNTIPLIRGAILMFTFLAVWALAAYKGGYMS